MGTLCILKKIVLQSCQMAHKNLKYISQLAFWELLTTHRWQSSIYYIVNIRLDRLASENDHKRALLNCHLFATFLLYGAIWRPKLKLFLCSFKFLSNVYWLGSHLHAFELFRGFFTRHLLRFGPLNEGIHWTYLSQSKKLLFSGLSLAS